MNLASYYYYIYLFIISIFSFKVFSSYRKKIVIYHKNDFLHGILMLVFAVLFIGLRPVSGAFTDMGSYTHHYETMLGMPFFFDRYAENVIFDNIMPFMASLGVSSTTYFLTIAFGYFGFMYWACKRFFPNDSFVAFLVCLGAFSTFSYGTNGIKAGLATSFFLMAISYRNKLWLCIPLVLISKGFHHGMTVPIVAFFCTLLCSKPKYYFYIWTASLIMAILHISAFMNLFASFTDDRGSDYLLGDMGTYIGFRPDFVLYSAMPVWLGWVSLKKIPKCSTTYKMLLNMYLLTNSVWMLCMYANFNNRIAYLSWFLYPIVLIYPLLIEDWQGNKYALFSKVGTYHLAFTLFMAIIYYGILRLGR